MQVEAEENQGGLGLAPWDVELCVEPSPKVLASTLNQATTP